MTRPTWTGRAVTQARAYLFARDGDRCWLCGHVGATSLDHVIPVKDAPHLEWEPSNWAPAHLGAAENETGCPASGCTCPGNSGRRAGQPETAPPSRAW